MIGRFIIKRFLSGIFALLGVCTLVFFLFNVLPGDSAQMTLGQRSDLGTLEAVNKELGLDKPLWQQYFFFLNDISPLSSHISSSENKEKYNYTSLLKFGENVLVIKKPYLRRSYQTRESVAAMLSQAMLPTAVLALTAMFIATLLGIGLGVLAALNVGTWIDRATISFAIIGVSIPSYFAAILIAYLFAYLLHSVTGLPMTGSLFAYHPFEGKVLALNHLILPAITLGIRPLAIIAQISRASYLDVFSKDYIRTAHAKGLPMRQVVWKHASKNAAGPIVTAISGWFASLLAGAVFVEYIFAWNGVGKLTVDALLKFDLPVVMGAVLFMASVFIVVNILVDLIYMKLDPKVVFK